MKEPTLEPWGGVIRGRTMMATAEDGEVRCPACAHLGRHGRHNRLARVGTHETEEARGALLLFECAEGHNWQVRILTEGATTTVEYVVVDAVHQSTRWMR